MLVLLNALEDKESYVRSSVAKALSKFGAVAIPSLSSCLKNSDNKVKSAAVEALGEMGPKAHKTIPSLVLCLQEKDEECRDLAGQALGKIGPAGILQALAEAGPKAKIAISKLINILEDQDHTLRMRAAICLGNIGAEAQAAPPMLKKLAKEDSAPVVRDKSIEAIRKITK